MEEKKRECSLCAEDNGQRRRSGRQAREVTVIIIIVTINPEWLTHRTLKRAYPRW
jgi:hypothetical protein